MSEHQDTPLDLSRTSVKVDPVSDVPSDCEVPLDLSNTLVKIEPASPIPSDNEERQSADPDYCTIPPTPYVNYPLQPQYVNYLHQSQYVSHSQPQYESHLQPQYVNHSQPQYVGHSQLQYLSHPQYVTHSQPQYTSHSQSQYVGHSQLQYVSHSQSQYVSIPHPLETYATPHSATSASSPPIQPAVIESLPQISTSRPTVSPPEPLLHIPEPESLSADEEYKEFERSSFQTMAERNGGIFLGSNPRMRRSVERADREVNDSYRQQRERNNLAAKRSRDRRKLREARLACQATFLQEKIAAMKARLASGVCKRCV